MKKIDFLLVVTLMSFISFSAKAAVIQLATGSNIDALVAGVSFNGAADNDIIELTTDGGAYTMASNPAGTINPMLANLHLTIRAASGLTNKPTITVSDPAGWGYILKIAGTSSITFQGVNINAASTPTHFIRMTSTTEVASVNFDNCVVSGLTSKNLITTNVAGQTNFSISLSNSQFNLTNASIYNNADWSNGKVNSLSVSNCFFNGTSTTYGFFGFSMVGYNPSVSTFDHCTFNGNTGQKDLTLPGTTTTITNSLFIGSGAASTVGGANLNTNNIGIYPAGNTSYFSTSGASTLTANPALDGSGYATGSAYVGNATDGKNIGYYNPNAPAGPTPSIITSSTMTAFGYTLGSGPSTSKSFTVSGTNLTAEVVLTAPANYEISTVAGSGYVAAPSVITLTQNAGTVATTTIYVRLAAGLGAASYSGNISVTSTGAAPSNVAVTGTVLPIPGITQLASGADIAGAVKNATTGDIIELTTDGGAYTWNAATNVLISQANLTIRAAVGLTNRPVITVQNNFDNNTCFNISAASNFTLQGVEIQNRPTDAFNTLMTTSTTANVTVNIDNCKFTSIKTGKEIFHPASQPAVFALNITNSIFALSNNSLIYLDTNVGNHVTDLNINNTLFTGTSMATGTIGFLGWGDSFQPNSIVLNHCTFTGNTGQADLVQVTTKTTSAAATITNCLFQGSGASSSIGTVSLDNATTGIYPAGNLSFFATAGANTLTTDPLITNGVATGTAYNKIGTDGHTIGYYASETLTTTTVSELNSEQKLSIIQKTETYYVNGVKDNTIYKVYSLSGCQLANGLINNGLFKINNLSQGIYFLRVNNNVCKFIVK